LSFIRVTDRLQGKTARVATAGQGIARRTFAFVQSAHVAFDATPVFACDGDCPGSLQSSVGGSSKP